jgi:hypothetical protein
MLLDRKKIAIWASLISCTTSLVVVPAAIASETIDEDSLNPQRSLRWAGEGLTFDRVLTIQDTLVAAPVGKVTISRDGHDSAPLFQLPFVGPNPGRITMVSLWGSKIEGCFVRAIVHNAGVIEGRNLPSLVPVKLEMGVNGQIVQLTPNPNSAPQGGVFDYEYTNNGSQRRGQYTVTDTTFAVNQTVANLLRNARSEQVRVRVTFANGKTQLFALGANSVSQWKEAYSFNPSCTRR